MPPEESRPQPFAATLEAIVGELQESFMRASGPGGQNVNKVATAVELRFDAGSTRLLSLRQKARLATLAGRRQTRDGVLVIRADRFRTQDRNRDDARERMLALIERALDEPKKRLKTRTPRVEKLKRRDDKGRRSVVKQTRRVRPDPD